MNVILLLLAAALTCPALPAEKSIPSLNNCEVYFPNAFSPNSDGINDEFKPAIANNCGFASFEINIYHKSGSLVYNSTDSTSGWDGRHRNQPAPADVYYYIAKYTVTANENEIPQIITGDLSLLR